MAHARVVLDQALIISGGDRGEAEIYFEGWVDDGLGGRRSFRIPRDGYIPEVKDGQLIPLRTAVFDGRVGEWLLVHVEAWDEDMGRDSLLNPDDLLGTHERRYTSTDRWGEGRHEEQMKTDSGAWRLTYTVELQKP